MTLTARRVALSVAAVGLTVIILWRVPINGAGSVVWLAGIVAMNLIRQPHVAANERLKTVGSQVGATERVLLAAVAITSAVLPTIQLVTGVLSFADYRLGTWATGLGAAILAFGLFLFWRSHADLGRNWSVSLEIKARHSLVTSGIYRHIRHPMYAAIWLIVLAQPLLVQNWIAGPLAIIAFGLMYASRSVHEEAMMREHFGAAYEAYCLKTGRVFPRFGRARTDRPDHD